MKKFSFNVIFHAWMQNLILTNKWLFIQKSFEISLLVDCFKKSAGVDSRKINPSDHCCLFYFLHWRHNTSTSLTNKRLEEIEKRFVMLYKLKSSPEVSFKSIQYFLHEYFLHYLNELLPFKIKNDGRFLSSVKKFSFLPFCKFLSRF